MGTLFRQSRGLLKIEAEILPDGVRYREKAFLKSHESTVRFEEIPDQITRAFHVNRLYLAISAFFAFLLVFRIHGFLIEGEVTAGALALSVAWFVAAVGGTWMQSPKWIGYVGHTFALMFFDAGGGSDPSEFIEEINRARYAYLASRYGKDAQGPLGADADLKLPVDNGPVN
ncbi:MAG TPA: hypothetical protein VLK65_29565 [Vicinamibacteria bacterium]|nr:hypothetical protein [Vicinamibacteria bacterium]